MNENPVPERLRLLLSDLAANIELPELAFDAGGYAALRYGDSIEVTFCGSAQGLTLGADLGPLPPHRDLERRALQASYAREGGPECWFALDGDGRLQIYRRLPLDGIDLAALEAGLAALLEEAAQWRALLASAPTADATGLQPHTMGNLA